MLSALASADAFTWLTIVVKALTYAATLMAAGSVLVRVSLSSLSADEQAFLVRIAAASAVVSAALSVVRLPLRAGFLTGGTLEGAFDPFLLGMVVESPLGDSVALRLAGLAMILAILVPGRSARWLATAGAGLVAISFAVRGHALEDPQLLLGGLVTVHILGLSFWIGAFAPLAHAARTRAPAEAGALAHEFGQKALWVVALVVLAGGAILVLLGARPGSALATPYGQMFVLKLVLFTGVLGLAAVNRLRLTPALRSAAPDSATRLRRSIRAETLLIAAILLITATLTTLTSPPANATRTAATHVEPMAG